MEQRIQEMITDVMAGRMWFETTPTAYDRCDLLLDPIEMSAKRVYEYILNQKPVITERSALAGYLRFDGSVEGDIFNREGHKAFLNLKEHFYNQPLDNLATFEWQHSVGDFKRIIDKGIEGIKEEIIQSMAVHSEPQEILFLKGLDTVCDAIIGWAEKCSAEAFARAKETQSPEYRRNLFRLGETLRKIPRRPAESFYEAVQCIYLCYAFLPDSIGLIDRQLYAWYRHDMDKGRLTREEAVSYLQELFLMLQSKLSVNDERFYRGGESHFCIGGYLPDGTDGFNELSRLILESLMELPTCIPQISLRWTQKTPHEVLRFVMDCERKDPNKRIAFVNDEPRIKALTEIVGFSYEQAVNYTMVGCNEPVMTGGRIQGSAQQNILRSMANTFQYRAEDLVKAETFDDFYRIYEEELFADAAKLIRIDTAMNLGMARDCNLVSCIFLDGCIETAKSATQGGAILGTATMDLIGIVNVIDSLAITRQFVYDEKRISMKTLTDAVNGNWKGYENMRREILNQGKFFGNDDEETNELAARFTTSLHLFLADKTNCFGKKFIIGNLIGYNQHNKWFGELTAATPDGRFAGEMMQFGIGQSEGKDRKGITALLNSVAQCDPTCLMTGPSVTNVLLEEQLVRNDAYFEKLVYLFEAYFQKGGTHFQLCYVSKEDLVNAKAEPDKYRSIRVRVSGFSDFFVRLNDDLQDEIIERTVKGN